MNKLRSTITLFIITLILLSTWSVVLTTQAAPPGNHFFNVTFTPTTVDVNQNIQFTVQITNDPASQGNIGSINLTTPLGFTVTTQPTVTSPSGTWTVNVQDAAKIGLKPSSPQETLPPGQTLTITFYATTPALPGSSTWTTECNTNPGFGGTPFNLPDGAQQPVIITSSALVAPSINAIPAIIDQGQASSLTSSTVTTGSAPYTYQWFRKSPTETEYQTLACETSSNYNFLTDSNTPVGTWSFILGITDSTGASVNSTEAIITVNPALAAPLVTASSSTIIQGQTSSLTSSDLTTGTTPYLYQWFQKSPSDTDFAPIDGATSNSYIFSTTASTATGAWSYNLKVTDDCEAYVTSNTITITCNPGQFLITATANPNGTISPSGSIYLNNGTNQVFTITPNTGYHIADVVVDGTSVGPVTSYEFTAVTTNHTITASFAIDTFTITVIQGDNGKITPGTSSVNYGDTPSFTITPNIGYEVIQVLIDGSPVTINGQNKHTFPAIHASHTITAKFTVNTNIILASAGAHGIINPNGIVFIDYGADQTFTMTAAANYHIMDVIVDGVSVGPVTSYTFTNIISDHNIRAIFEMNDPTIFANAGPNGTINPSGTVLLGYGDSQTFTFTPAPGYHIAEVKVDGNAVDTQNSYTFNHVTNDHTISVTFTLNQYTITVISPFGSPTPSALVNEGSNFSASVASIEGDTQQRWICKGYSIDGEPINPGITHTLVNIKADHTITFSWQEQYYINIISQYATTTGTGWYNSGTTVTVSVLNDIIPANDGTRRVFNGWSGAASGTALTSNPIQVDSPKTVTANWKTQYHLTVNSETGNPTGQGWYDAGTIATFSVNTLVAGGSGVQSVFKTWTGTDGAYTGQLPSSLVIMNSPITETATWTTQYQVTYITSGNALQVTTPPAEWVNSGAAATNAFPKSVTNTAQDIKCSLVTDDRPTTITKPVTVTGTYQTQYLLMFSQNGIASDSLGTILTVLGNPKTYEQLATSMWMDRDSSVAFSYAQTVKTTNAGKQYSLKNTNATSPLTINAPTFVQGNYEPKNEPETSTPLSTIALSALLLLLLALLAVLLLARRRKKKATTNADEVGS